MARASNLHVACDADGPDSLTLAGWLVLFGGSRGRGFYRFDSLLQPLYNANITWPLTLRGML